MGRKKYALLRAFGLTKKKSPEDKWKEYSPEIVGLLKQLPNGSTDQVALAQEFKQIHAAAHGDPAVSPTTPLQDLKKKVQTAIQTRSGLEEVSIEEEVGTTREEVIDAIVEDMTAEFDGELAKQVARHTTAAYKLIDGLAPNLKQLGDRLKLQDPTVEINEGVGIPKEVSALRNATREKCFGEFRAEALSIETLQNEDEAGRRTSALQEALESHMAEVGAAVLAIKRRIEVMLSSPTKLNEELKIQTDDKAAREALKAFLDAQTETDAKISQLEDWGSDKASALRSRYNSIAVPALGSEDVDTAKEAIDALLEDTGGEIDTHLGLYNTKAGEVTKAYEALIARGRSVVLEINLASSGLEVETDLDNAWVNALIDKIRDEKDALEAIIANGANFEALRYAEKQIAEYDRQLEAADTNPQGMAKLARAQEICTRALVAKNAEKFCPELHKALKEEYEATVAKMSGKSVEAAVTAFEALAAKMEGAETALKELSEARKTMVEAFDKQAGDLRKKALPGLLKLFKTGSVSVHNVDNLDDPKFFKEYHGAYAGKIDALEIKFQSEDLVTLRAAKDEFAALQREIVGMIQALKAAPESRTDEQNKAIEAEVRAQGTGVGEATKAEEDKAAFKEAMTSFKAFVKDAQSQARARKDLVMDIKATAKMSGNAQSMMDSTGNLEKAKGILDTAKQQIQRSLNQLKVRSPQLRNLSADWAAAVNKSIAKFGDIETKAKAAADGADPALVAAANKVKAALTGATAYFTAGTPFKDAEDIYKAHDSGPELKRARELALQQVRLFNEYLANDPILRAAQTNPFGVTDVVSPIFSKLREIEAKTLVVV